MNRLIPQFSERPPPQHSVIVSTCTAFVLLFTLLLIPSITHAQTDCTPASTASGSLDTCFGSSGKMTTSLGGTTSSWAADVALQADGKMVIAAT